MFIACFFAFFRWISGSRSFPAWRFVALAGIALALGACTTQTPPLPPAPTDVPQIIILTPIIELVTIPPLTPTITAVPTGTPTLPPQISGLIGTWSIQIDYWLQGAGLFDQIHYAGQGTLTVSKGDRVFTASGIVKWTIIPSEGSCGIALDPGKDLTAALTGQVPLDSDQPMLNLSIDPQPISSPLINAVCPNPDLNQQNISLPPLTFTLDVTHQLQLSMPLQNGVVYKSVRSLSTASGGALRGTLVTQIAFSR